MTLWGLSALACYAIHAAFHLANARWYDLFWACHLAAVFIGSGLILRSAVANGIGVLLGLMGLPLWIADLAAGSTFYPTSLLTHVVALGIGLYGVNRLGMARGTWWKSTIALVGLIAVARLVTPPESNVNLAYAAPPGWNRDSASHAGYLAMALTAAAAYFFAIERLARWLISKKP